MCVERWTDTWWCSIPPNKNTLRQSVHAHTPSPMAATAVQAPPGGAGHAAPPPPTATSAAGLLALLAEPDPALSAAALRGLNACVPSFWFEIAQSIALVEAKADDPGFEHRELAALVASKVRARRGPVGARALFDKARHARHRMPFSLSPPDAPTLTALTRSHARRSSTTWASSMTR